jgi:cytochrome P450
MVGIVWTGYKISKGSGFFISVYALHNDPRVWGDDVATFTPERWMTEDPVAARKVKNSFFGFGDGPRVCPGSRFALTEAKIALVRIYQKFSLELGPGQVSTAGTYYFSYYIYFPTPF